MAAEDDTLQTPVNSATSVNTVNQDDPLYVSSSDHPNMMLVNANSLFTGDNFLNWSRAVVLALECKNKSCFIDGTYSKPSAGDAKYKQWCRVDSLVKCWILNSMTAAIASAYMLVRGARQLWDELLEQFGQTNGPMLYQLRQDLNDISQNQSSLAEYYGKLKRKWDDLQDLEPFPDCTCGGLDDCTCGILKRVLEIESRTKLIQFLMRLDSKYETVRGSILAMEPLPSVSKAYSLLLRIEKQQQITDLMTCEPESSALAVHNSFGNGNNKRQKNDYRVCTQCKSRGHLAETCFQRPGAEVPEWYKQLQERKDNMVIAKEEIFGPVMSLIIQDNRRSNQKSKFDQVWISSRDSDQKHRHSKYSIKIN